MKPFRLQDYTTERRICTAKGEPVEILTTQRKKVGKEIIAAILDDKGEEKKLISCNTEGQIIQEDGTVKQILFFETTEQTIWINIYKTFYDNTEVTGTIYYTEEDALTAAALFEQDFITTKRISWEK